MSGGSSLPARLTRCCHGARTVARSPAPHPRAASNPAIRPRAAGCPPGPRQADITHPSHRPPEDRWLAPPHTLAGQCCSTGIVAKAGRGARWSVWHLPRPSSVRPDVERPTRDSASRSALSGGDFIHAVPCAGRGWDRFAACGIMRDQVRRVIGRSSACTLAQYSDLSDRRYLKDDDNI